MSAGWNNTPITALSLSLPFSFIISHHLEDVMTQEVICHLDGCFGAEVEQSRLSVWSEELQTVSAECVIDAVFMKSANTREVSK